MTEVHRIVLLIVDLDGVGADGVREVIENQRYPNHCIGPKVMETQTREVEWTDDHSLNSKFTNEEEFCRMFDKGGRQDEGTER